MEEIKILSLNSLLMLFLIVACHIKTSKYIILPAIIALSFFLGHYISQERKESSIYAEQNKILQKIKSDSLNDLNNDIYIQKCKYFKENYKGHFLTNYVCKNKKDNKRLSYQFIANSPVTVLVKDDFAYKFTPYINKNRMAILYVLKYSFLSLIPEFRESINKELNEYKSGVDHGVTYLDLVQQMPLFYNYESFGQCGAFNCGITIKVVPDDELPAGKFYKVQPFPLGKPDKTN